MNIPQLPKPPIVLCGVMLLLVNLTLATEAGRSNRQTSGCPQCGKTCFVTARCVEQNKSCFRVECRDVCIPKVRFPWEKSDCHPKCGKVIRVNVLIQDSYRCRACKYEWRISPCCPDGTTSPVPPTEADRPARPAPLPHDSPAK